MCSGYVVHHLLTDKSVIFCFIQGRIMYHRPDAVALHAGIIYHTSAVYTAARRHRLVLATDSRWSAPLETATSDADSFLDDGRMGVESSEKIMVQS